MRELQARLYKAVLTLKQYNRGEYYTVQGTDISFSREEIVTMQEEYISLLKKTMNINDQKKLRV